MKGSRIVHDQISGWLEDFVLPELGKLRGEFLWQYLCIFHRWCEFHLQHEGIDDQASLDRFAGFAEEALRDIASQYPARLWLHVTRSLPLPVFAYVSMTDEPARVQELVKIATAAACLYGAETTELFEDRNSNGLAVTPEWLQGFQRSLPVDLPRFIGAAHSWYYARGWYRIAGKGGVLERPQAVDLKAARQAIDALPPDGVLHVPSPTFANRDEIMPEVTDYDRRTAEAGSSSYTGVLRAGPRSEDRKPDLLSWWRAGINVEAGEAKQTVIYYPLQKRTITTASYFPVPEDVGPHLDALAPFQALMPQRLGMAFEPFALCCRAVAAIVRHQTGFLQLRPARAADRPLQFRAEHQSPEQERLSSEFLFSVTQRGLLRAPRSAWLREMSRLSAEGGSQASERDSAMFVELFTRSHRLDPDLEPSLFWRTDPKTLVLDLISMSEFFDFCLRKVTSIDDSPSPEARRGAHFEQSAWRILRSQLPVELAVDLNTRLREGEVEGEVDIAFVVDGTLVVLECKSWQKRKDYFRGDRTAIERRHDQLRRIIQGQLDRTVSLLRNHLGAKLRGDTLSFVCVAGPEFIKPGYPGLWYGSTRRVMTPQEMFGLILDTPRWNDTLRAVREAGSPIKSLLRRD